MLGTTHKLVANLALANLDQSERNVLFPRWGGIEAGATLSDEFRIMWEPVSCDDQSKQLVHRCYVDSSDIKNHGCITRAMDHTQGALAFIKDFSEGHLEGTYNELEFLENLGVYCGVASHHVADLCSPVHVGHKIDLEAMGSKSFSDFHAKVERDILRLQGYLSINLVKPSIIDISEESFWNIARETYYGAFLHLESCYKNHDEARLVNIFSKLVSQAVEETTHLWHTILSVSGMLDEEWSMEPLL